jgi:hypothetical protein
MTELLHSLVDELTKKEFLENLPEVGLELIKTIQLESFLKLCDYYGSSRLHPPKMITINHKLVTLIGLEDATALCKEYGGDHINLPKCKELITVARDKKILQCINMEGLCNREIAIKFQITSRHVTNIRAKIKQSIKPKKLSLTTKETSWTQSKH